MRSIGILVALFIVCFSNTYSQNLSVFDIDASYFPTVKAKFIAYDNNYQRLLNLGISDFTVSESGQIEQ